MTIARNRPAGGWAGTTTVSSAEFEHFDRYLSEAIHGQGGAYTLSQELVIGGDNVIIDEGLIVNGDIAVGDDVDVGGDLDVAGHVVISQTLFVGGLVALDDDLEVAGDAEITGHAQVDQTLYVGGLVSFNDDLNVAGLLDVDGGATISGSSVLSALTVGSTMDAQGPVFLGGVSDDVDVRGTAIFRKRLAFVDSGKIEHRQQVIATDAVQTVFPALVDTVFLPNGVFTALRVITIDDTGATNGMRVYFHNADPANGLQIKDPSANTLDTLLGVTKTWGFAERIGGQWIWAKGEIT